MRAIDALRPPGQRQIVCKPGEPDDDILLVPQIMKRLSNLLDELRGHIDSLLAVMQRSDKIPHFRSPRMTFDIAQFADRFHSANFYAFDLVRHQELLQCNAVFDLVVPDLNLDPSIERHPRLGGIRSDRFAVTGPFVGYCFRRQRKGRLNVLCHLTGAFPGQSSVVTVDSCKCI